MERIKSSWVILCVAGWLAFTVTVILFITRSDVVRPIADTRGHFTIENVHPQVSSYEPVGSGFTVVVEDIDSGGQGVHQGRALFFSHRTLGLRAILETGYPTYVVPSWSPNRFLVAWNVATTKRDVFQTKIVEFDPEENKVVSEYTHSRGLPFLSLPGAMLNQEHPLAAGRGGLLWFVAQEQVDVVDWSKKAVVRQLKNPSRSNVVVAIEDACLIVDGNLTAVFLDGQTKPLSLNLEEGRPLSYVHSADNLLCGFGSSSTLVVIEYLPQQKKCIVRFKKDVVPPGYQVKRACVIPKDNSVMIGLNRVGEEGIEKVFFVSASDGSIVREGNLAKPADLISYGDEHIWAFSLEAQSMMTYDRNLKLVRRPSLPFNYLLDLAP